MIRAGRSGIATGPVARNAGPSVREQTPPPRPMQPLRGNLAT
jgi:hypothetical protein